MDQEQEFDHILTVDHLEQNEEEIEHFNEIVIEVGPDEVEEEEDERLQREEEDYRQLAAFRAIKESILVRKKRAARIRKALCRKSNILKIKLWRNSVSQPQEQRSPSPTSPQSQSPSPSPSPSTSPTPMTHRFSPDITQPYRRKSLLMPPKSSQTPCSPASSPRSNSVQSSVNESDDEEDNEREMKEGEERENGDSNSVKSNDFSDGSGGECPTSTLILSNRGEPVVKLDASVVEDFLRSGKPIRAAALAALEAVHGKKFTEVEALQRLRKAYIFKPSVPKGRGRRSIVKKYSKPTRAPRPSNWCSVEKSLTYKNSYYQVGDIVYLCAEEGQIYFLQIQTLLMDRREGEGYASMMWLTPKPDFKGSRFPFHPKNYDLRRDVSPLDSSLDSVTHLMHCPLDYFDGHQSFWQPVAGCVYQRLGDPLVKWVPLDQPKQNVVIKQEIEKDKNCDVQQQLPEIVGETTDEICGDIMDEGEIKEEIVEIDTDPDDLYLNPSMSSTNIDMENCVELCDPNAS